MMYAATQALVSVDQGGVTRLVKVVEGPRSEPVKPQKMLALPDGLLALEDDWQEEVGAADATVAVGAADAATVAEHFFDAVTGTLVEEYWLIQLGRKAKMPNGSE